MVFVSRRCYIWKCKYQTQSNLTSSHWFSLLSHKQKLSVVCPRGATHPLTSDSFLIQNFPNENSTFLIHKGFPSESPRTKQSQTENRKTIREERNWRRTRKRMWLQIEPHLTKYNSYYHKIYWQCFLLTQMVSRRMTVLVSAGRVIVMTRTRWRVSEWRGNIYSWGIDDRKRKYSNGRGQREIKSPVGTDGSEKCSASFGYK